MWINSIAVVILIIAYIFMVMPFVGGLFHDSGFYWQDLRLGLVVHSIFVVFVMVLTSITLALLHLTN